MNPVPCRYPAKEVREKTNAQSSAELKAQAIEDAEDDSVMDEDP